MREEQTFDRIDFEESTIAKRAEASKLVRRLRPMLERSRRTLQQSWPRREPLLHKSDTSKSTFRKFQEAKFVLLSNRRKFCCGGRRLADSQRKEGSADLRDILLN
jgi:hypothetical protein